MSNLLDSLVVFNFECVALFLSCWTYTKKIPGPLKKFQERSMVSRQYLENGAVNASIHISKNSIKKGSRNWNMQCTGLFKPRIIPSFQLLLFLHLRLRPKKLILSPLILFYTLSWLVSFILLTSTNFTCNTLTILTMFPILTWWSFPLEEWIFYWYSKLNKFKTKTTSHLPPTRINPPMSHQ